AGVSFRMKSRTPIALGAALGALGVLAVASNASAQASLVADKKASAGSTEAAAEGFQNVEVAQEDVTDETVTKLSAGGFLSTGNARSMAVTGAGQTRIRRGDNQYSADVAGNFARAAATPLVPLEKTVENYQARIRYDRFLSERWALFVSESGRHDRFQGLDLRLNFDPGVAYYFVIEPKQHLWLEGGYDLQYDLRSDAAIAAALADGTPVGKTEVRHAARAFLGYDNNLNDAVTFDTGLEYIQAFEDTNNFRLNWVSGVTSAFSKSFSFATTFTLRYDNNPLPGVEKLDTITAVSLVYTML